MLERGMLGPNLKFFIFSRIPPFRHFLDLDKIEGADFKYDISFSKLQSKYTQKDIYFCFA